MPRMEIELTSTSDSGTWTWRAAGAKLPKGSLDGSLLNGGESVGDVLKVETEQFVDGITVTSVLTTRTPRSAPELLEILGSGKETPLVTSTLASKKGRRSDNDQRDNNGLLPHEPNGYAPVTPIVMPPWQSSLKNFNSWAVNFLATASPDCAPKSLNKMPPLRRPANQPSLKPSC